MNTLKVLLKNVSGFRLSLSVYAYHLLCARKYDNFLGSKTARVTSDGKIVKHFF